MLISLFPARHGQHISRVTTAMTVRRALFSLVDKLRKALGPYGGLTVWICLWAAIAYILERL